MRRNSKKVESVAPAEVAAAAAAAAAVVVLK